jgi:hypothetical protein
MCARRDWRAGQAALLNDPETYSRREASVPQGNCSRANGAGARAVRALLDLEEFFPDGVDDRLHTGVQVEFLENVANVVLDGVLGDHEVLGNVTVGVPTGDKLEHLELPGCEAGARYDCRSSVRLTMVANSERSLEAIEGEMRD